MIPILIVVALLIGGLLTYSFINPTDAIEKNEQAELENLENTFGEKISKIIDDSSSELAPVIERYMYLKHKYANNRKAKKNWRNVNSGIPLDKENNYRKTN